MIENAQLNLTGVNQSAWSLARWSGGPALRRRCRHHARRLQVLLQQFLVRNRQVEEVAVAGETLKLSPRLHWLGSNLLKKSCSQVSFDFSPHLTSVASLWHFQWHDQFTFLVFRHIFSSLVSHSFFSLTSSLYLPYNSYRRVLYRMTGRVQRI